MGGAGSFTRVVRTRTARWVVAIVAAVALVSGIATAAAMAVGAPPKWASDVVAKSPGKTASSLMAKPDVMASRAPRDDTRPRVRAAYENAVAVANADGTNCGVRYAVLAAVGSVESSLGRPNSRTVIRDSDGRVEPPIYGPLLNGVEGMSEVPDSDHGVYDEDPDWDRAVGPLQFLPSTWYRIKADANGDGTKDPQSIDDAALGALHYLCLAIRGASIDEGDNLATALFSYNRSKSYVARVIAIVDDLEGR
jgi:membrane-bound lytic murein transglycosylase B